MLASSKALGSQHTNTLTHDTRANLVPGQTQESSRSVYTSYGYKHGSRNHVKRKHTYT